nr:hypothetical protein [uncultured Capnocytophaga sp.]
MGRIWMFLLALLTLMGCRTRKTTITEQKQVQKERIIKYKDSTALFQQNAQALQLDTHALQEYEVTVESDKDSIGNSKELVYYRIRDGDNESIRVSGGKVKITTKSSLSGSLQRADSTFYNNLYVGSRNEDERVIDNNISHKTTEREPVWRWQWWLGVLVVIAVVGWWYKRL